MTLSPCTYILVTVAWIFEFFLTYVEQLKSPLILIFNLGFKLHKLCLIYQ